MKKVVLTLCILLAGVIGAFADDPVTVVKLTDSTHTILGGIVKSVSWADPSKGTRSEIVIKDTAGKTVHILVTSTTTLWDADAKAISLPDKIVTHSHVNVIYSTTPEGINIGKTIKILK